MAITGCLSGTFTIIAIISSIKKMFGNGRVKGQEYENTEEQICHLDAVKYVPCKNVLRQHGFSGTISDKINTKQSM